MKKLYLIVKGILTLGNDSLAHTLLGAFFALKLGWFGLIPSFISHYLLVDIFPHNPIFEEKTYTTKLGMLKGAFFEFLKGGMLAIIILIFVFIKFGFAQSVLVTVSLFVSFLPDFIMVPAAVFKTKIFEVLNYPHNHFKSCLHNHLTDFSVDHMKKRFYCGVYLTWWNLFQIIPAILTIIIFW